MKNLKPQLLSSLVALTAFSTLPAVAFDGTAITDGLVALGVTATAVFVALAAYNVIRMLGRKGASLANGR